MRITEVLRSIFNKFIRQDTKTEPQSNQISPEPLSFPKLPEEAQVKWKTTEHERKIRRYREFAFHHRKKRIRKKYSKKLMNLTRNEIKEVFPWCKDLHNTQGERIKIAGGRWAEGTGMGMRMGHFEFYHQYGSAYSEYGNIFRSRGFANDHEDCRMNGGLNEK